MRVGMEATGYSRWFERLLAELGFEVWIGDAAEIKTKRVSKQKTDRDDALLLLKLLLENRFPQNLGTESGESGSAAVAVASASAGSDADPDHESAAGHRHERRQSLEEKAVERARSSLAGETSVSSLGQSAPARINGVAGPTGSNHRGINGSG